jgi:hypothetical protein
MLAFYERQFPFRRDGRAHRAAYVHPLFQRAALRRERVAPGLRPSMRVWWGIELLRLLRRVGRDFSSRRFGGWQQTTAWGDALQMCFKFATPFFLVTALFFRRARVKRDATLWRVTARPSKAGATLPSAF